MPAMPAARTCDGVNRAWDSRAAQRRARKKSSQQRRRLGLADAAIDLGPVQAGRRGEIAHAVLDRAALGIGGAVIEPPDAGERDRRRAHRAGLERHVEIAVDEPLAAERLRRPRGSPPSRHARSDRDRRACDCRPARSRRRRARSRSRSAPRRPSPAACASSSARSMKLCSVILRSIGCRRSVSSSVSTCQLARTGI